MIEPGDSATVDLSGLFTSSVDLTYSAASSDTYVLAVSLDGSVLTLTAGAEGTASVTARAHGSGVESAASGFGVVVNYSPFPTELDLGIRQLYLDSELSIGLSYYFTDPPDDVADDLTFAAGSSDESQIATVLEGSVLTLTGLVGGGSATIWATATDPQGASASLTETVLVDAEDNRAPVAVGSLSDWTLAEGERVAPYVTGAFYDPDGDTFSLDAWSTNPDVMTAHTEYKVVWSAYGPPDTASVEIVMVLQGVSEGSAIAFLRATDPDGETAFHSANVTVTSSAVSVEMGSAWARPAGPGPHPDGSFPPTLVLVSNAACPMRREGGNPVELSPGCAISAP